MRRPLAQALTAIVTVHVLAAARPATAGAQDSQQPPTGGRPLSQLSLDELGDVEVTSVSKMPESLLRTPAAVYVITQEDIRRSGATTLPEILRLAPGVHVGRIDSDHWAVGVRGFGDQFSKSVLVLMDGRSLYTPLFAGIFWGAQDTLIDDIEHIEVIRGPGGTIWGANAVNGVINIITKNANETNGLLGTGHLGTAERALGAFRYGRNLGGNVGVRIYGKALKREAEFHTDGKNFDEWRLGQAGFRADWGQGVNNLTLQGDAYTADEGQSVALSSYSPFADVVNYESVRLAGANAMLSWKRALAPTNDVQLRAYYDRTALAGPQLEQTRNTIDLDFVQRFGLGSRQNIFWGAGMHVAASDFTQTVPTLDLVPREETDSIFSASAQDEIAIVPSRLYVSIGAKVEHNNFTGAELQPSLRALWLPSPSHSVWFATTRAVRTPSQIEEHLQLTRFAGGQVPTFVRVLGNTEMESEVLKGVEAGYRVALGDSAFLEASVFRNRHDRLQSFGAASVIVETTPAPSHLVLALPYANGAGGPSFGGEVTANWKATPFAQIKAWYSFLDLDIENTSRVTDVLGVIRLYNGSSPRHQTYVQGLLTFPGGWEVDQTWRHISALPARSVPAYTTLDARVGYRLSSSFDVSLVGQNLLQDHHGEFGHDPPPNVEIRRSAYVRVTWRR